MAADPPRLIWDDLSISLRHQIHWDALTWFEHRPGLIAFGCGCVKKDGYAYLCDYHTKELEQQ